MGIQYIQQKPDGTQGAKLQAAWSTTDNTATLNVPGLTTPAANFEAN
jgi:hypothetical protein